MNLIEYTVIIVVILIVIITLIKRFVYFRPSANIIPTDLPYEDINQGNLHGRFFKAGDKSKVIVFCHGKGGNLTYRNDKISALVGLGFSVLIFDYSGYGLSKGISSEQQCYDDASMFVTFLRQTYSPEQLVIYGESLGAPVALYIARMYNIHTVVIESSLVSIKQIIKDKYGIPFISIFFPEFDTEKFLSGFKGRVLMLHSIADEKIPYSSTLRLQGMVSKFIPINGGHDTPVIPWEDVSNFINENSRKET
jgi:hypothetical protein